MKNYNKKIKEKLKKDLKVFNSDWKKNMDEKNICKNKKYLKKISDDIKNLNNDLLLTKHEGISDQIAHMLTTAIGAPFVADYTLLDAALNFENQTPDHSDLSELMSHVAKYEKYFDGEIYQIFESFLQKLDN